MRRRIWAGSEERLNIQFNPAALLSFGDAHAFMQALLDIAPKAPGVPKGGPTPSTVSTNTKMAQLDSGPEMGEQMAQRGAITSRSALPDGSCVELTSTSLQAVMTESYDGYSVPFTSHIRSDASSFTAGMPDGQASLQLVIAIPDNMGWAKCC